jgi:hypothetical protein
MSILILLSPLVLRGSTLLEAREWMYAGCAMVEMSRGWHTGYPGKERVMGGDVHVKEEEDAVVYHSS